MAEKILIAFLGILVIILTALIYFRIKSEKKTIRIRGETAEELISSIMKNIMEGKIADISERISEILRKHLLCDRILFLRYMKGGLILRSYMGIERPPHRDFRLKVNTSLKKKISSFFTVTDISTLNQVFPIEYVERLKKFDLNYFFPVFLRRSLYGIYFIRTPLSRENSHLNLLATTLAFNLSAAYHIEGLNQKIKRFENRGKDSPKPREAAAQQDSPGTEMLKYLKLKNCRQLVPELIKSLRKDCRLSVMGFYVRSDSEETPLLSISWNIDPRADEILKTNHDLIVGRMEPSRVLRLGEAAKIESALEKSIPELAKSGLSHLIAMPWVDRKRALLAWGSGGRQEDIASRVKKFQREAMPIIENIRRFEKAEELSYTDGLTGTYNFRYFKKRVQEEFQRAKRYGRNLALIIFDIDDLKAVNDRYGHLAGDSLLKYFAETLQRTVRSNDVISRYGGDEFCLIMPEAEREDAELFMERIRKEIASGNSQAARSQGLRNFTVSIGGAVFPLDADSIESLINAADMALLDAKNGGRNCFRLYQQKEDQKG